MRRNIGARGAVMNTGSGLLGEGPALGAGMKRMMAGTGSGGSWPSEGRMQQQPRSLLNTNEYQGGRTEQHNTGAGLLERKEVRDRSPYGHGGGMEQSRELGYYDERGDNNRYIEEQAVYQPEYNNQGAGNYEQQKEYGQEHNKNAEMHFDYNHGNRSSQEVDSHHESDYNQRGIKQRADMYEDQHGNKRGLLGEPPARGGKLEKPPRLFDELVRQGLEDQYNERGNQEQQREPRSLLGMPCEERDIISQSMEHHDYLQPEYQHGVVEAPRGQRGHMNSSREQRSHIDSLREQRSHIDLPRDQRGIMEPHREQHDFMDMQREHRGLLEPPRERRGLMELPEPPRPPMNLMDSSMEPRSLMDTQMNQRGLLDPSRDVRDQRGILDAPRDQRGLFDIPRDQRGLLDSPRQQKGMNKRRGKQNELMEKADLQMKLLQQEKLREHEQMEQLNLLQQQQQAIMVQQQQQQMQQQIQQQLQEKMEEQEEIKQQMQHAELIMAGKQVSRGGSIPSLFDLPARGKRPAPPSRISDNKRPRTVPADRRDRRPPSVPERRRIPISRSIERQRDRTRRTRFSSPAKKQDRKDSGSTRNATSKPAAASKDRSVKGRVRDEKAKSKDEKGKSRDESIKPKDEKEKRKDKEQSKTEVIVIMDEEYDPAEPTGDGIAMKETGGGQDEAVEKIEKEETGTKIEDKLDDNTVKEISLTVTVNKKGRSVNDADMNDSEKTGGGKMYKCNVCTIECFDEESFHRHMNGKKHSDKMKIVMSSTTQPGILNSSTMIKSRQQAEEHLRQIEGLKKSPNKRATNGQVTPKRKTLESHCKVCEKKFTGAYKFHKEAPEHKALEDRSKAGCKVCKVASFKSYQDFVSHLRSNWHLKNKKSSHDDDEDDLGDLVTLDTIGFEDDANVDKTGKDAEKVIFTMPTPVEKIQRPATSTPKADSTSMKVECITPVKPEEESIVPEIYDSSIAVGQRYVIPVSGFFCKLCHKFYNNEIAAKISHCQSQAHYEKLKKTLAAKRAKGNVTSKKLDVGHPLFKADDESEEINEKASQQENLVETGNQAMNDSARDKSIDDTTNMEETSQYETADEHQDSTVNAGNQADDDDDDGNGTMEAEDGTGNDVESLDGSQGSPVEDVDDKTVTSIKKHVQSTRGRRARKN